jgi:hypothetical protein
MFDESLADLEGWCNGCHEFVHGYSDHDPLTEDCPEMLMVPAQVQTEVAAVLGGYDPDLDFFDYRYKNARHTGEKMNDAVLVPTLKSFTPTSKQTEVLNIPCVRPEIQPTRPCPNHKATWEWITPEYASDMLENHNETNRPIMKSHRRQLSEEMTAGLWNESTADPVRIDKNGNLADGQHRFGAAVDAKFSFWCYVVREVNPDDFHDYDKNQKRSFSQNLARQQESHCRMTAAALQLLKKYQSKRMRVGGEMKSREALEFLQKHPTLVDSGTWGVKSREVVSEAVGMFCHYLFSGIDPHQADEFYTSLISGANLDEGNPILVIRERLLREKGASTRRTSYYKVAVLIQAWNLWRTGKKKIRPQAINWAPDHQFPVAI